jgi:predicted nucleic acid-binding protein
LKLVIDACSLINLQKSGVFDIVLGLKTHEFYVGSFVKDECGTFLQPYIERGLLRELSDERLSADAFSEVQTRYDLGFGETECITFALLEGMSVCSDDAKARKSAQTELGENRVTGTLFLLRDCVKNDALTAESAFVAYEQMRAKGAFLPDLQDGYFLITAVGG